MDFLTFCSILAEIVRTWPQTPGKGPFDNRLNTFAPIISEDDLFATSIAKDRRYAHAPYFFSRAWDLQGLAPSEIVHEYPHLYAWEDSDGLNIKQDCIESFTTIRICLSAPVGPTPSYEGPVDEEYEETPEIVSQRLLGYAIRVFARLNAYRYIPEPITDQATGAFVVLPAGWYHPAYIQAVVESFGNPVNDVYTLPITSKLETVDNSGRVFFQVGPDNCVHRYYLVRIKNHFNAQNVELNTGLPVPTPIGDPNGAVAFDFTPPDPGGDFELTKEGIEEVFTGEILTHTHPISGVTGLAEALSGKAAADHGHEIGDVDGLQSALDGKSATGHTHSQSEVSGLTLELAVIGNAINVLNDQLNSKSDTGHGHDIEDITNLSTVLSEKSNTGHSHAIADITDLQTELDGKADTGHGHTISEIQDLQAELDGKSDTGHSHSISDVTDLQTELDGKADTGHGHDISDITGLQTELNNKATASHTHAISEITDLQAALDGKALAPSRTRMVAIESDFQLNNALGIPGMLGASTASAALLTISGLPSHPGVLEFRDSTSVNSNYRFLTDVNAFRLAGGEKSVFVFQARGIRATESFRLGFQDQTVIQTQPVDGVYFQSVSNGTITTIRGRARNNNAQTDTADAFTLTLNTWYTGIIELNADATLATFTLFSEEGAQLWTGTIGTNIPTAVGRETGWGVIAGETTTDAAAGILWMDYLRMEIERDLVR